MICRERHQANANMKPYQKFFKNPEKWRKNNSESKKGHIVSTESREKMRASNSGQKSARWKHGLSKNKEYLRAYNRKWFLENKELVYFYNKRRVAQKKTSGGTHTFGDWLNLKAQYNWTCPCCKVSEPEIKLEQDHIVPVSRGGSDNIENIQPLCRKCNMKKWAKTQKYV